MRKELTCFITTNEEGEEIKVSRVADDPQFFLLSLGANRMVLNAAELIESIEQISYYAAMFDHESQIKEKRRAAPPPVVVADQAPLVPKLKKVSKNKEDEGALVLESAGGPTASELALEQMIGNMNGESIVVVEKK